MTDGSGARSLVLCPSIHVGPEAGSLSAAQCFVSEGHSCSPSLPRCCLRRINLGPLAFCVFGGFPSSLETLTFQCPCSEPVPTCCGHAPVVPRWALGCGRSVRSSVCSCTDSGSRAASHATGETPLRTASGPQCGQAGNSYLEGLRVGQMAFPCRNMLEAAADCVHRELLMEVCTPMFYFFRTPCCRGAGEAILLLLVNSFLSNLVL